MPKYIVSIKGRGRGLRSIIVRSSGPAQIKKDANKWLEAGSIVSIASTKTPLKIKSRFATK